MNGVMETRSEKFLKMYRILEGMLEKRYSGKRQNSSVVMEYLHDVDSEPCRYELNICREIRNLLSHNADDTGEAIIEPSEGILASLQEIIEYVSTPKYAYAYGTPSERILSAHSNDLAIEVMHRMAKLGYSHVPVIEKGILMGVFSMGSLFHYLEKHGLGSLNATARIGQLQDVLDVEKHGSEKYLVMPEDTTIVTVRSAFEERIERNSRLSAVFITHTGDIDEPLLAMLTPWDVLKDMNSVE